MIRVMIIDDERSLRGLLKNIIPWEELGLILAGEATSGVEAINKIDELRPHIVLVDIMMPFMDGIEFSKLARERYPELKIIILTAYEDFGYAKASISFGAADYLLKPINRKELTETLRKVAATVVIHDEQIPAGEPEGTIESVKAYLEKEYRDSNMNLTSVAQYFGFHPSYLSRRFSAEVGRSFIDYLTGYRVEKACELAENGELMYIAAAKTGILDPNYFGKCFKKYKGVSYSEYVKQHARRKQES